MGWFEQIDAYCERIDFSMWSEPVNAVTNAAFLIAAIVMWRRSKGLIGARALTIVLFAIGVGSGLFHTFATTWASTADVFPIVVFILLYLFLVHVHLIRWPVWAAAIATLGFVPFAIGITVIFQDVPFFSISSFYWSVPILLVVYAPFIGGKTARGFLIGAALLALSITVRSLDVALYDVWPLGTHFGWHILNAVMLGFMIDVYRRHMVEAPAIQG
ncbi:hypothetical protein L0664_02795 [Octadecabacter sp. G9-8]|uniref:Ceramidase n=1 Tax=Octadecabacter dasysiphoniae TaxID=2909341 RepID=A0ABS9CU82_9RHOB|nr:hypothetical protein [Octadecabacter dasysiphoniae]MCF2869985.1 hypothetical protein [Octadecabacter dasysiphoniae]